MACPVCNMHYAKCNGFALYAMYAYREVTKAWYDGMVVLQLAVGEGLGR